MATVPDGMSRDEFIRAVDWVIRQRSTRKVAAGAAAGEAGEAPLTSAEFSKALHDIVQVAGWAPFHYPRTSEIPEPWRFYVFDRHNLDSLVQRIQKLMIGKLPVIFGGAGAMVQVTWLPETAEEKARVNWEHAAAAAAATQNLLLAAEARGMATYWCTAAPLASEEMFSACGISRNESYLASIFLGWPLSPEREAQEGFSGKMRSRRTQATSAWAKWVQF